MDNKYRFKITANSISNMFFEDYDWEDPISPTKGKNNLSNFFPLSPIFNFLLRFNLRYQGWWGRRHNQMA